LLDYLASRFMQAGWSVKALHRLILNSSVYQLGSQESAEGLRQDPANRLLWRHARRRLEAEAIRDAILCVSGTLDLARPGPHPFPPPEKWTWTQHTPFKERYESMHRSVYLMTQRLQRHPFLALFDGPDTNNSTESRRASIVPQQALFAMNHPFVDEQARHLAERVRASSADRALRVHQLHELAWSRPPVRAETKRCLGWLEEAVRAGAAAGLDPDRAEAEAWTCLARVMITANEFLYVD
jgi:hypothetical protein